MKPSVVVVGAGFGGLRVAKALRNADIHLTVIDKNNHHLFQPLLYQVASASLSPADIASPIRSLLRAPNTEVLMEEVVGVDVKEKKVRLAHRDIPYDYLVLATGAKHSYFGKDEWEKFAPGLKSLPDATQIRQKILLAFEQAEMEPDEAVRARLLHFILVGGGPTGVEMAGAIAELAHRALASDFRRINPHTTKVSLVEAGPRILPSFPEVLSEKAKKALEGLGVSVLTDSRVENIDENGVWIKGECLRSQTILWAAGVAASPAGKWLGCEVDRTGRVKVAPDLSVPGHPNIFVIGDTALVLGEDGKPLPGVAPVAMQQGHYLGSLLKDRIAGEKSSAPFRYFDKGNLATVGRRFAIADLGKIRLSGWIAWMAWLLVHIFYLIGFRNRVLVLIEWGWSYVTFQRGARLILRS